MARQQWTVGQTVKVGGIELFVQGEAAPTKPGEPRGYLVETLDRQKAYIWRPFRGLKLIRGELVRPGRKRKPKAARVRQAPVPQAAMVARGGLWSRLKARFGLRRLAQSKPAVKPPKARRKSHSPGPPGGQIDGPPRP
jgi:hypothetical protein